MSTSKKYVIPTLLLSTTTFLSSVRASDALIVSQESYGQATTEFTIVTTSTTKEDKNIECAYRTTPQSLVSVQPDITNRTVTVLTQVIYKRPDGSTYSVDKPLTVAMENVRERIRYTHNDSALRSTPIHKYDYRLRKENGEEVVVRDQEVADSTSAAHVAQPNPTVSESFGPDPNNGNTTINVNINTATTYRRPDGTTHTVTTSVPQVWSIKTETQKVHTHDHMPAEHVVQRGGRLFGGGQTLLGATRTNYYNDNERRVATRPDGTDVEISGWRTVSQSTTAHWEQRWV